MAASQKRVEFPGDQPTGKQRTFLVTVSKTVEVTFDTSVLAQGTLPYNPILGKDPSEEDVLQHLLFNLVGNGLDLSQIEGYANCPNASAKVAYEDWDVYVEREIVPRHTLLVRACAAFLSERSERDQSREVRMVFRDLLRDKLVRRLKDAYVLTPAGRLLAAEKVEGP